MSLRAGMNAPRQPAIPASASEPPMNFSNDRRSIVGIELRWGNSSSAGPAVVYLLMLSVTNGAVGQLGLSDSERPGYLFPLGVRTIARLALAGRPALLGS